MKKFALIFLARTKKTVTSALMGLAILFVTLNFVSATLSLRAYSSNTNISYGAGIPNNVTKTDAFPFENTRLQDNDDAEEAPNLTLKSVKRSASTIDEKTLRKDLNLIDLRDSFRDLCVSEDCNCNFDSPNLTKIISEWRSGNPVEQEIYKNTLDFYEAEAKKSEYDPSKSDYLDKLRQKTFKMFNDSQAGTAAFNGNPFENENIILTYDNNGSEDNFPNLLNQAVKERISDDTGNYFDENGYPRPLMIMPTLDPPPPGLFGASSGNNPDAVATNISHAPIHKRTRSEVTSTYGRTNRNDPDAFPSIWDDSLNGSE